VSSVDLGDGVFAGIATLRDRLGVAALPMGAGALLAIVASARYATGGYGGATVAALAAVVCFAFGAVLE